jgi:cytochrome d ubiquinol oxidase subunit I
VAPVFWGFRIMVGMGLLMLAVSWASVWQLAPWKEKAPTLPASRGSLPPGGAECRGSEPAGAGLDGTKSDCVSQSCGLQGLRLRAGEAGSAAPAREEEALTPLFTVTLRELRPWLLKVLVAMTFAGWVALIAGWYVTEIGRQPWLVSGVLTAADAASQVVAPKIAVTLSLYLALYAALIAAYVSVVFYLASHASHSDQPSGDDQQASLNAVNHPEKQGAVHA